MHRNWLTDASDIVIMLSTWCFKIPPAISNTNKILSTAKLPSPLMIYKVKWYLLRRSPRHLCDHPLTGLSIANPHSGSPSVNICIFLLQTSSWLPFECLYAFLLIESDGIHNALFNTLIDLIVLSNSPSLAIFISWGLARLLKGGRQMSHTRHEGTQPHCSFQEGPRKYEVHIFLGGGHVKVQKTEEHREEKEGVQGVWGDA